MRKLINPGNELRKGKRRKSVREKRLRNREKRELVDESQE
jgi:hypothetical protein